MKKFGYVLAAVGALAVALPTLASAETVVIKRGHHHGPYGARAEYGMHRDHGWHRGLLRMGKRRREKQECEERKRFHGGSIRGSMAAACRDRAVWRAGFAQLRAGAGEVQPKRGHAALQ